MHLHVKFVIIIFPYVLSKCPSEGSLNVLWIAHDAFELFKTYGLKLDYIYMSSSLSWSFLMFCQSVLVKVILMFFEFNMMLLNQLYCWKCPTFVCHLSSHNWFMEVDCWMCQIMICQDDDSPCAIAYNLIHINFIQNFQTFNWPSPCLSRYINCPFFFRPSKKIMKLFICTHEGY